ncbi:MAG: flagellar hook-associated protein FlgK [Sulfurimonas sp.]|uniref:flagellar hook-associated protein FlgK n=1 Tax=Sulfurimonas sp. TaxID=2022749 RepID=UPI0025CCDC89|nr:flagellar hook-associated protein FlgK [Sulfurimonas sp.]MCK9491848.1 flagellar hook-associated protein FlgK [Sulfurimonas sp.]
MASIFNALHIGYSGLKVAQAGINTTGHNIAGDKIEGYSRQRVVVKAATPLSTYPGNVGNGAEVQDIQRIFDNFVFDRYSAVSRDKEFSDFEKKTLDELSTYFPEIDGVGIKADMTMYYDMWQTFADNPDNDAIKLALTTQTHTLTKHISNTQNQVKSLQSQLNDQLAVNINEVNSIAQKIASINKSIDIAEAGDTFTANDLRDQRNVLERNLSRLIGADVNSGQLTSNMQISSSSNTKTGSYSIHVNGFNIVDGNTHHPIHLSNENNLNGFYEVAYERQDGTLIPMAEKITGGVIGSILNLRGSSIDTTSGMPTDGVIQNVISQMDSFAKGLIESTNNIYARGATTRMESNEITLNPTDAMMNSLNINAGTFSVVIYDLDGNVTSSREITINQATTMTGTVGSNSIQGQLEAQKDDNADGNANNDIDDFINFNWGTLKNGNNAMELTLDSVAESKGYTFAIHDTLKNDSYKTGTNFAGAMGLNRYFDGDSAQSIELNQAIANNPTLASAGQTPSSGDNVVALNMIQHQYEKFDFKVGSQKYELTSYAMFDLVATEVGSKTMAATLKNETITTQFRATEMEYNSVSKVSLDEEMTNLIKYQTSYGAAAKVITTVDQMMTTLLGIKQ